MQIYGMRLTHLPYLPLFTSNVSESEENLIINFMNHISFSSMFAPIINVIFMHFW